MTDQPTVAPPPAAPERRLVRRPEGKMVAGVCSGLAAYTGVDPVAWRIGFVVLTLVSGGLVILAYIAAWVIMPMAREGDPLPPAPSDPTRFRRFIGIGAVVIGAVVLFRDAFQVRGSIFWGLLLIGTGLAFWGWELSGRNGAPRIPSRPTVPVPPAPPPPPVGGGAPPLPPVPSASAASSAPAPSPVRREPSMLGRLVVGAAALAVGIALLLENVDAIDVTPHGVLLVLLVITGLGLLVGSVWGRARWLIFPGVAIVLALGAVTYVPTEPGGAFGNVTWQPASQQEVRRVYAHSFGNAILDLTRVEFEDPQRLELNVRFGNLEVVIPEDVPVVVRGEARFGNLEIFGREYSGIRSGDRVSEPGDPELGTLGIVTHVAFGNTEIRRARPGDVSLQERDERVRVRVGPGMRLDVQTDGNER